MALRGGVTHRPLFNNGMFDFEPYFFQPDILSALCRVTAERSSTADLASAIQGAAEEMRVQAGVHSMTRSGKWCGKPADCSDRRHERDGVVLMASGSSGRGTKRSVEASDEEIQALRSQLLGRVAFHLEKELPDVVREVDAAPNATIMDLGLSSAAGLCARRPPPSRAPAFSRMSDARAPLLQVWRSKGGCAARWRLTYAAGTARLSPPPAPSGLRARGHPPP